MALLGLAGCGGGQAPEGDGAWQSPTPGAMLAPADYAEVGFARDREELEQAGLAFDRLPGDAALVGPHHALALDSVAVTGELTLPQLEATRLHTGLGDLVTSLQAGAGREFLVVYVTKPDPAQIQSIGGGTAEVVVEGEARPLAYGVPHELTVVVVNVPAGADAALAVTDAGETTSISLRTGELASGGSDSPADELVGDSVSLEDGVQISGVTPPDSVERLLVTVGASPYSYLDDHGRAEPGRMWLEVEFQLTMGGQAYEQAELQLDLAGSLTLQGGGDQIPIPADAELQADSTTVPGVVLLSWSGVIEVPDRVREVAVSFYTTGRFTDGSREIPFTRYDQENTGTLDFTG